MSAADRPMRKLGAFELTILSDGTYYLDAGGLFGVVPKSLWEKKIKADAQRALALLPSEAELRSLGWKCAACGHVKHFTRPVTAAVADTCPKCKGDSFLAQ